MDFPRRDEPGTLVEVSRDALDTLLDPSRRDDHGYALAHACNLHGGVPCALLVLEDGVRYIATDLTGDIADLSRDYHGLCTATRNRQLERSNTIWDSRPPTRTIPLSWQDTVDAIVELATVPVSLGLCDHPNDYPGWFGPRDWGQPQTYKRPTDFGARTRLPDSATVNPQPVFLPDGLTLEQAIDEVTAAIDAAVAVALRRRAAKPPAPAAKSQRRKRPPEFRGSKQAVQAAEAELALWRRFYAECRQTFRVLQDVVFPRGTVRFRKLGALVDPFRPITYNLKRIEAPPC